MATILIAGTDANAIEILSSEIMGLGHVVVEAMDGQEAYEETLSRVPDMVILETSLPVFDGYEVCEMLRGDPEVAAELPIILMTDEEQSPHRLEQVGATDILSTIHDGSVLPELLSTLLPPESFPEPPEDECIQPR